MGRRLDTPPTGSDLDGAALAALSSLPELIELVGVNASQVIKVLEGDHVRQFQIPKRDGSLRAIQAPTEFAKQVQRATTQHLRGKLRPHRSAVGFIPHIGGTTAAKRVSKTISRSGGWVLQADLRDAFPTVTEPQVVAILRESGLTGFGLHLATRASVWRGHLLVGGCASPDILNLALRGLDKEMKGFADELGGQWVRYADDCTLALPARDRQGNLVTKSRARGIFRRVLAAIRRHGWKPHPRKQTVTRVWKRDEAAEVVGVTVTRQHHIHPPQRIKRRARVCSRIVATQGDENPDPRAVGLLGWFAYTNRRYSAKRWRGGLSPPAASLANI
jgi:hypothetical protein